MADADPLAAVAQHLREGRANDAVPLLEAMRGAAPDRADVLHLLGIAHGQLGAFDAALPMLERAAALRPDDASIHNNFGNTLAGCDRDDEAVAAFDRALALQPQHAMAWRNRGAALRRLGRLLDALDSFDRALSVDASFVDALIGRADALEALQRRTEAIDAYRAALDAGGDADALRYSLAGLGAEPLPSTAPSTFVRTLFDQYAGHFDKHLVERLQYRAPQLIAAALDAAGAGNGLDVVDLGCGTGLCGPLLRPRARRLVGIDLSPVMLEKARRRGDYDELDDAEIVEWLGRHRAAFDLAVAADVLIYLGDLVPLFAALDAALRPGGLFAFSVEDWPGEGFGLKPSGRFGHAAGHLRELVGRCGFTIASFETAALRNESHQPIEGHVAVVRRRGA